jgi:hypothetical protein
MSDFILNNLSTTTIQNELLVSGGTIDLQAFSNGEKLELNDLVNLQVQFKNRSEDDGMMPYYAYEGETVMKWSTDAPPSANTMDSVLISKAFKMRNLDTMEITTEQLKNIDGTIYKVVTHQRRTHPSKDFETEVEMEETSQADLVSELLFSSDRSFTEQYKPKAQKLSFTMPTRRAGYLNCDSPIFKYLPRNQPLDSEPMIVSRTLTLEIVNSEVPSVSIVFDSLNTVIPYTRRENNMFIFDNVLQDQSFSVIAVYADNRGVMMGKLKDQVLKREAKADSDKMKMQMKPCTENEVRLAVQEMDDRRSN